MIGVGIVVGLMIARVLLQMAQPRFTRVHLSAARFFNKLPDAQDPIDLRLGPPIPTRSFVVQMLALALLLWAILLLQPFENPFETRRLGIRVTVDTSGSMRTQHADGTRMAAAQRAVEDLISTVALADSTGAVCWELETFDLELKQIPFNHTTAGLRRAVEQLAPRALGTDLNLLRTVNTPSESAPTPACEITHRVVVTDQPAPDWAAQAQAPPLLWRDIAQLKKNHGFREIRAIRNQLTGVATKVQLEMIAYGAPPGDVKLESTAPNGKTENVAVEWFEDNTATFAYPLAEPGTYTFRLVPGGAYDLDDVAMLEVQSAPQVRIDWQLPERTLLSRLEQSGGWLATAVDPDVRVVTDFAQADNVPTLIVGKGYAMAPSASEMTKFYEASPLGADLNLDVAERIRMAPAENLPEGFEIILAGQAGGTEGVWIAERLNPPAVYVPGLPTGTDELNRFSSTVFFNALRHLLQVRSFEPLYTLTSAAEPEPQGTRLALHPEEGNTTIPALSFGEDALLITEHPRAPRDPSWAILLAIAALLFAFDRIFAVTGFLQWN